MFGSQSRITESVPQETSIWSSGVKTTWKASRSLAGIDSSSLWVARYQRRTVPSSPAVANPLLSELKATPLTSFWPVGKESFSWKVLAS